MLTRCLLANIKALNLQCPCFRSGFLSMYPCLREMKVCLFIIHVYISLHIKEQKYLSFPLKILHFTKVLKQDRSQRKYLRA